MNIIRRVKETYADGPDIRYSIYVSGCTHHCKGCHNPQSWDFNVGEPLTDELVEIIKDEVNSNPLLGGITISGGDPMCSSKDLLYLLRELSTLNKDIWVYTGYTIEEIVSLPVDYNKLYSLEYIDVLVDGKFVEELRDTSGFKGSTNQRYILAKKCIENYKDNGGTLSKVFIKEDNNA